MKTIGIGLIGTGYMGKCHALAWTGVAATFGETLRPRLVHLAEVNADLAHTKATEFGFARSSGDWRALIADPEVDVVSVTTPNAFHADMAIAALQAGKHVWCEKPMATALADAARMRETARASGRIAVLGYNYIQNPTVRQIEALIAGGAIGTVNHIRIEMDEDFMADAEAPFNWKNEAASGYGALDDFAVHPLSLMTRFLSLPSEVLADMSRPVASRPLADGSRRAVETHDIANVLLRFPGGASGVLTANRAAWGRKGRIFVQIFGSAGTLHFDQERGNEFNLYLAKGDPATQGFRTVLLGPQHAPYDRFIPAPGHGLGFNDLKVIEAHELIRALNGDADARVIDFETGLAIEGCVHAMAKSHADGRWTPTGA
ncbi:Gfo/Idh/MocA family protein [Oryzibacter oryziterrae]|uniref:Gfo/Idh/MocA family protein n=1 Tax=Oryzibacter oryziterrae TaxID=2766474 RepID=UPI001F310BB0|nr:Gfo/Idh/MocA family oxidoreductase [Oryzibacter oryziterrae]